MGDSSSGSSLLEPARLVARAHPQAGGLPTKRYSAASQDSSHSSGDREMQRAVSPSGSHRSNSPSIRSFPSTSTLDSIIACEASPPLPLVIVIRDCLLRKRPPNTTGSGWGFVLRGTTSEFAEGTKIYTCHIESVHENGAAKIAGLKEGDQIVSIDGVQVKHLEHPAVVKMFQTRDKVSLGILSAQFKTCVQARVTKFNMLSLNYLWALMRHMHTLEIINVNLGEERSPDLAGVDFGVLLSLRSLTLNHCSLTALEQLKGLPRLHRLESLSVAHNFISHEVLGRDSPLLALSLLRRLDLSRNLLNQLPEVITSMSNLEVLILVDNNISELPMSLARLTNLHTLCIDGNMIREVDKTLSLLPSIQKLTMSNNFLECESQAVRLREFLITSIQGNPFSTPDETGTVSRREPSLRRTLSVRGYVISNKMDRLRERRHSVEWDDRNGSFFDDYIATQ